MVKDICIRESYTDSQGTEQTSWNKIGIMIDKGDKQYIKLFHIPNVLCSVFEQKKKEKKAAPQEDLYQGGMYDPSEEGF